MRSTGEVMGIDENFSAAYAKAALAAGQRLPMSGKVFITMIDKYKQAIVPVAKVRLCKHCATNLGMSAFDLSSLSTAERFVLESLLADTETMLSGHGWWCQSCL